MPSLLHYAAMPPQPQPSQEMFSDLEQNEAPEPSDQGSISEEEEARDLALLDDEGLASDQSAFTGLFRPQIFRSLLFKVLAVTCLGGTSTTGEAPSASADPASSLFAELEVEPETIPAPKLFTDVIQRQWALPGSSPTLNGLDKCLYQTAPALSNLLQVPAVDAPIVALTSTTRITGSPEEYLRPEDKRAEKTPIKGHQAAAWAVCTSTSASFFNRASLLWLRQLQDRLPPSDTNSPGSKQDSCGP